MTNQNKKNRKIINFIHQKIPYHKKEILQLLKSKHTLILLIFLRIHNPHNISTIMMNYPPLYSHEYIIKKFRLTRLFIVSQLPYHYDLLAYHLINPFSIQTDETLFPETTFKRIEMTGSDATAILIDKINLNTRLIPCDYLSSKKEWIFGLVQLICRLEKLFNDGIDGEFIEHYIKF